MSTSIRICDIVTVASEPGDSRWREYDGKPRRWRVSSYLKPAVFKPLGGIFDEILFESCQESGPDKCRLQWCSQDEAVYVSLTGVCGAIARVTDCEVVDRVNWMPDQIAEEEDHAKRLIGEMIF